MHRILTFITRLTRFCLRSLNYRFVAWTIPDTTSLLLGTLTDQARSKSQLVAENALLRQQLIILRRQVKRPACTKTDRMLLVLLARMVHTWKQALFIVQPETLLRWHRQGFKLLWKYKSRATSTTPKISVETVALIQEMARNNRLWGAERIRGELLKLGLHVCKRTIQKYMRQVITTRPRGQTWSTFLHTHAQQIWACDAPACHRSLLPLAVRLLHCRTALAQSDPRGCDTISHRRLDGTYRFEKPLPMGWVRNTSSVITIASLEWVSRGWLLRVTSRFSKPPITPREPMPSVSGSWAVCDVSALIICSSCMRNSSTACSMRMCTISTEPDRIKASSNRFPSRKPDQCHHIQDVARFSPSQS